MNRQSSTVVTLWKHGLPLSQAVLLLLLTTLTLQGEPQDLAQQLDKATSAAITATEATKEYRLAYRMKAGQNIRSRVVHLVSMDTKIEGEFESLKSRSVSTRVFQISNVDDQGNMTFVHLVEDAELWQKVTGHDEVRYDSKRNEVVPENYIKVAEAIGKPLATITVSPTGTVVRRDDAVSQFNPGIGMLLPQLPSKSVRIGQRWFSMEKVRVRLKNGRVQAIQIRKQYKLEHVKNGLATISVRTQVLTPVSDPKIQSQLMQRLQHGTIKFDLDAGRIYSSKMELDERVIGFRGAASMIHYLSRMTETQVISNGPRPAASSNGQGD
jgi:hypothetical protein